MRRLFELNDRNLSWHSDQGVVCSEPGAALVEDSGVVFGHDALTRSRLQPRGFHNEHWQLLNGEALSISAPGVHNNADLVYQHTQIMLQKLSGGPSSAICATVTGLTTPEQLGMLLGILQEAQMPLRSFADSAVLYALDLPLPEQSFCFDVHSRRGVLTELVRKDGLLSRGEVIAVPQLGLLPTIEGWLDLLVDHFVSRTRFDPLRVAATEQQLFDQVLDWLPGEAPFKPEVTHEGTQRSVDVSLEEMSARAQQRYVTLVKQIPSRATIVLTPQAAELPGFEYYLSGHGFTVYTSSAAALWSNASTHETLFTADPSAVQLITQLPMEEQSGLQTSGADTISDQRLATHLLADNQATPIAAHGNGLQALELGCGWTNEAISKQMSEGAAVSVNDQPAQPQVPLIVGDRVGIDGHEFICIRVSDGQT